MDVYVFMWIIVASAYIFPFIAVFLMIMSFQPKYRVRKSRIVLRVLACLLLIPDIINGFLFVKNKVIEHEEKKILWKCICNGYYEDAEKLMKNSVPADCTRDSNEKANPDENTILSRIGEEGIYFSYQGEHILKASELLIKYGADVNCKYHDEFDYSYYGDSENNYFSSAGRDGDTPLISAVKHQNHELVELLLKNGADVNDTNDNGFSALAILADEGESDPEILKLLIDNGAEIPDKTNFGQPLDFLVFRHHETSLDNAVNFMVTVDPDYLNLKDNVKESDYTGTWNCGDTFLTIYKDEQYMAVVMDANDDGAEVWKYPLEFEKGYMINVSDGGKYEFKTDAENITNVLSGLSVFSITEDGLVWRDLLEDKGADKVFTPLPSDETLSLYFTDEGFGIRR